MDYCGCLPMGVVADAVMAVLVLSPTLFLRRMRIDWWSNPGFASTVREWVPPDGRLDDPPLLGEPQARGAEGHTPSHPICHRWSSWSLRCTR